MKVKGARLASGWWMVLIKHGKNDFELWITDSLTESSMGWSWRGDEALIVEVMLKEDLYD